MRYNIKRLANEIITYDSALRRLREAYEKSPEYGEKGCVRQDVSRERNSKQHARSICQRNIATEVMARLELGQSLDEENEYTPILKAF